MELLGLSIPSQTLYNDIAIIGVNHFERSAGNDTITQERSLPWLQDTEEADMWSSWNASLRDLYIVNTDLSYYQEYNLSSFDLQLSANKNELKNILTELAGNPSAP